MLSNPNKCSNFKASTNYENSVFFQTLVEQDENVSSQVRWFRKQILTQIGILEIYQIANGLVTNTPVLKEGKRRGKEAGLPVTFCGSRAQRSLSWSPSSSPSLFVTHWVWVLLPGPYSCQSMGVPGMPGYPLPWMQQQVREPLGAEWLRCGGETLLALAGGLGSG